MSEDGGKFVFMFHVSTISASDSGRSRSKVCDHPHLVGTWLDARNWLQEKAEKLTRLHLAGVGSVAKHHSIEVVAVSIAAEKRDHKAEESLNALAKFYLEDEGGFAR